MLYRGQRYGEQAGEWWTTNRDEAVSFAMSRGGRSWVVLRLDEEDETWLASFLFYQRAGHNKGDWYRIPLTELRKRWSGVTVDSGAIAI